MANNTAKLQDTFVFKNINGPTEKLTKQLLTIIDSGIVLTPENMVQEFLIINKNFKYPLKNDVLAAISTGKIVMMYAPTGVKLPSCMGWFLTANPKTRQPIAVVNIDIYGERNKDTGDVNIDPKKLYCLLEGAYLGLVSYENRLALRTKNGIVTNGANIYASMVTKVLNKKYALNVDRNKQNIIMFLSAKFFMINVLGLDNTDTVDTYAMKCCVNPNRIILEEISDSFSKPNIFDDFSTFMQEIISNELTKHIVPGLTVRGFLEQFIFMYSATALFALESFPYFLYNINGVYMGAYINNQYVLEDIVEKFAGGLYREMLRMK